MKQISSDKLILSWREAAKWGYIYDFMIPCYMPTVKSIPHKVVSKSPLLMNYFCTWPVSPRLLLFWGEPVKAWSGLYTQMIEYMVWEIILARYCYCTRGIDDGDKTTLKLPLTNDRCWEMYWDILLSICKCITNNRMCRNIYSYVWHNKSQYAEIYMHSYI